MGNTRSSVRKIGPCKVLARINDNAYGSKLSNIVLGSVSVWMGTQYFSIELIPTYHFRVTTMCVCVYKHKVSPNTLANILAQLHVL